MSSRPVIFSRAPRRGERLLTTDGPGVTLGEEIGRGGQGAVFGVEGDPHRCVKLYFEPDEARAEALRTRFDRLRAKNTSEDPRLVLPTALISAPATGYVMHRVNEADPLSSKALAPRGQPVGDWYLRTGGLRGRLAVAHELVRAFRDLHLRGLSYGDLSWDNVLVPRRGAPAVHLIDCDNLSVDGATPPAILGTPWFIAPEIVRGTQRPDAISDQHSLAVLLYHLLVLAHPLLGDVIRNGSPEDEQAALRGEWPFQPPRASAKAPAHTPLPWIDHPQDGRNRTTAGLPRGLVLSRLLASLFEKAFGEGLLGPDRLRRPSEGAWLDGLGRAMDATVQCPCKHTYYVSSQACPWCDARRPSHWVLLCAHADGRRPVVVQQQRRLFGRHLGSAGAEGEIALLRAEGGALVLTAKASLKVKDQLLHAGEEQRLNIGDTFGLPTGGVVIEVQNG